MMNISVNHYHTWNDKWIIDSTWTPYIVSLRFVRLNIKLSLASNIGQHLNLAKQIALNLIIGILNPVNSPVTTWFVMPSLWKKHGLNKVHLSNFFAIINLSIITISKSILNKMNFIHQIKNNSNVFHNADGVIHKIWNHTHAPFANTYHHHHHFYIFLHSIAAIWISVQWWHTIHSWHTIQVMRFIHSFIHVPMVKMAIPIFVFCLIEPGKLWIFFIFFHFVFLIFDFPFVAVYVFLMLHIYESHRVRKI